MEVLRAPTPAGLLSTRPSLPKLDLPTLLDQRRLLLRRAMVAAKNDLNEQSALIGLLAARGYTIHPDDWWPPLAQMQEIDVYAPWAAWREGSATRATEDTPTATSWQDWSWTQRRNGLARLRGIDAEAGRTLLQSVFASEPADKRVILLATLSKDLSAEDAPFLDSLASDRSDRVKQLARQMLTRLGRFSGPEEVEAELADFFETGKKGLLRRTASVSLKPLKTPAQYQRLHQLLDLTTLPAFATQLGLTDVALVQAWEPNKQTPDAALVGLVLLTGGPAAIEALIVRFEDDFPLHPGLASQLSELVPLEAHTRLIKASIRREIDPGFATTLILSARERGKLDRTSIETSSAWKALTDAATATSEEGQRLREHQLARGLSALGLLASAGAAKWIIDTFVALGLSPADPAFNALALNAALDERPPA